MPTLPVAVGFDGSRHALTALRWALDAAATHAAALRLVYAVEPRPYAVPTTEQHPGGGERSRAELMLAEAIAVAAHTHPTVAVTGAVLAGPAVALLCQQSRDARMLVLGSRGRDGFTGLAVGSVSLAVAAHAQCSVIVVPDGEPIPTEGWRPVVVGVDDSPQAQAAIGFAAEEAAARGAALVAVHAWTPPPAPWSVDVRPVVADTTDLEGAARQVLAAALHGWHDKYPGVPMSTRLMPYDARRALVVASRDAQLVVVGRHGTSGPHSIRLVSQYLLHHAACPVAVVHDGGIGPGTATASAS